jgi:hypothetical protein
MPKTLEGNSPMTKGIGDITIPFAVPVYPKAPSSEGGGSGLEIKALAKSSAKSWLEDATQENMNPRRDWSAAQIGFTGPYTLIAEARGSLPSFVDNTKKSAAEARVIVAGTSALLDDQVMGPQNAALMMNMIDWLSLDAKLLEMRSRGASEAPIAPDLNDLGRNVVKYGNVIGVPILLALVGVIRWRLREARRKRLMAAAGGAP